MTQMLVGCGGCGLFLHHTPNCTWKDGWKATYYRYQVRYEEGFDTLDEALQFLVSGEDYGNLSSESIIAPDGSIARSRDADGGPYEWLLTNGRTVHDD